MNDAYETNPLRKAALNYLARREYSAKELTDKLVHKGFKPDAIAQELVYLQAHGWQSDLRFAECVLRTRVAAGYGLYYIQRELAIKGVDTNIVQAALSKNVIDWKQQIKMILARHFWKSASSKSNNDKLIKTKQTVYLLRKGFNLELIKEVLNE